MSDIDWRREWGEPVRVPMASKPAFVGEGDVAVSAAPYDPMRIGRRFWFDVSEEVLSKIGGYALEHAIADMGHAVANQPNIRHEVERAVFRFITTEANREWLEPLVRQIVTDSLGEHIREVAKDMAQQQAFWMIADALNAQNRDDDQ